MEKRANKYITVGILGIGIILVVVGVINGDPTHVMEKAANICLECIGIG